MPDTFDYSAFDIRRPRGANALDSLAMFYQRSLYKEAVYPIDEPPALDLWYDKTLYGKIDRVQNTIIPEDRRIVPVPSSKSTRVYAFDFVGLALEDFIQHMNSVDINGGLSSFGSGDLRNIEAQIGWVCPQKIYSQYVGNLYQGLVRYYLKRQDVELHQFSSFVPIMKNFLKQSAKVLPVTMTNALLTTVVSSQISGLSIKIVAYDSGDDALKADKFVNNPNFSYYRKAAKKFGLIVNKNSPWILTADLFSPAIMKYISLANRVGLTPGGTITKTNFFPRYYNLTCLKDISNIKKMFVNFYNRYIETSPFYEIEKEPTPQCPHTIRVEHITRAEATMEYLDSFMTDFDWLDFYIELREIEAGGTPLKLNYVKRIARDIYEISPRSNLSRLLNAVIYVNRMYRKYLYDPAHMNLLIQNQLTDQAEGATISTSRTNAMGGTGAY